MVEFAAITTPDSAVRSLGNRPALHDGTVAFYGYRGENYGTDVVVAIAPADGNGGYTFLAQEGDPRPDVDESVFDAFGNPAIYNGSVVFYGSQFGTLPSTYQASYSDKYSLYDDAGISNPFLSGLGVTTPASPSGIAYIDNAHDTVFLGLRETPLPCGVGDFGFNNINGLQHVPHGGDYLIWPARSNLLDYLVVAYDTSSGQLNCVVTESSDTIPEFGGPFGFFSESDTDGINAVFVGFEPTISFDRFQGIYIRDVSGSGPITRIVDNEMAAPGGIGDFGSFGHVTIDGDLVIFEACAGGSGGCATYGFYGCFLDDGIPGPIFKILTTVDTIAGLSINDLNMSVTGRDGDQFAFDVRHSVQSTSLYVATISRPSPGCLADFTGDGVLDFFDVSAFLNAFNAGDPAADLTGDGVNDFFDVSAFLNAFSAGCP